MTLTDADHTMIHLAKTRGRILVDRDGKQIDAVLIAWKPRRRDRHRNVARVQFIATDNQATVPTHAVHLP